jgi:hypothetical protein
MQTVTRLVFSTVRVTAGNQISKREFTQIHQDLPIYQNLGVKTLHLK